MTCQQIESLLPPFVDGSASVEDARRVSIHVATCDECRRLADAQRVARTVLRARAHELSPMAPPGLRIRVAAVSQSSPTQQESPGWRGRVSAFAAAVLIVLTAGAILLPVLTTRSTVLLAAQLALDHLKCFMIDGDAASAPMTSAQAEETIRTLYQRSLKVPAGIETGMSLVAVRKCLYGAGQAAHALYRMNGAPVSLFILPGLARPPSELGVLGHTEIVWSGGSNTYMLVAGAGVSDRLQRVASQFRIEAQ
jgi:anti-sigma factor RsiW